MSVAVTGHKHLYTTQIMVKFKITNSGAIAATGFPSAALRSISPWSRPGPWKGRRRKLANSAL
jgi:hypothetical protein